MSPQTVYRLLNNAEKMIKACEENNSPWGISYWKKVRDKIAKKWRKKLN